MWNSINKSQTMVYLLVGYGMATILFALSWVVTSAQINDHVELIHGSKQTAKKMNVIANLIEIARTRTRLSHLMILTEDVFEQDEIHQDILSLAGDFVEKRSELLQLNLSDKEKAILENQKKIYPIIINNIDQIAELSLEDTSEARHEARMLLLENIMPNQEKVIEGFMEILVTTENEVKLSAERMDQKHAAHTKTRIFTLIFIFLISAWVMYVVIKNILKIENTLYDQSVSDALTGVLNRRSFDLSIHKEWKRALRTSQPISLLFVDIDYFKNYNDHYGHQAGDQCLSRIAGILEHLARRPEDIVARYGGEEFAIILPNIDEQGAHAVAQRLIERLNSEHIPHDRSEISEYVTVSIGLASVIPTIEQSYEELIRASDHALYQSKRNGRNRITVYHPEKDGNVIELFSTS